MLSNKEIRYLYGTAKEYHTDNENLHNIIFECTGKDSVKKLESKELPRILARIKGKKYTETESWRITPSQRNYIEGMGTELGESEEWLDGFAKQCTGIGSVSWLSKAQAAKVIEGLKKRIEEMKVKQKSKQEVL